MADYNSAVQRMAKTSLPETIGSSPLSALLSEHKEADGVATGRCYRDSTIDIKGALPPPLPAKPRKALAAKEIPKFMNRLQSYDREKTTGLALRLLVLTLVRTGELRFARWAEFENLDGKELLWRIPKERMKLRRPHLVPLAPQAVSVLKVLQKLMGKGGISFPRQRAPRSSLKTRFSTPRTEWDTTITLLCTGFVRPRPRF